MGKLIVDLKPCPFCGAKAQVGTFDRKTFYVMCTGCNAESGGYDTLFDVVAAWNRRKGDGTENGNNSTAGKSERSA